MLIVMVRWTAEFVLQDGRQRNNQRNQPYFRDFSPR